jgi:DNA-binding XRE family transcriptional regulator
MGVQTFRIIREMLGWTRYKMAKELGISQTQYDYLEREAKSTQTKLLIKLKKVSGLSGNEFWKIFEREVKEKE